MYSTTNKPEHVHRMKGGLEGSSQGGSSATEKMQKTGKNVASSMGDTMGQAKEKMGMKK